MNTLPVAKTFFFLCAIDPDLAYTCLMTRFAVSDLTELRRIVTPSDSDNASLEHQRKLSPSELSGICRTFNVEFDHGDREVFLNRDSGHHNSPPYLLHSGFELPLLLEGRKKFGKIELDTQTASPARRHMQARFDHYVTAGMLHSEEDSYCIEDEPNRRIGTTYYAAKGEEWRIPAYKLLLRASAESGGWNQYFERIEGMLIGYQDWENTWWLDANADGGGVIYGGSFCFSVTQKGLEWIEHSGYRALPPAEGPEFTFRSFHDKTDSDAQALLSETPGSCALIQFNLHLKHLLKSCDLRNSGPWTIPSSIIPEINRHLSRPVRVVARRNSVFE